MVAHLDGLPGGSCSAGGNHPQFVDRRFRKLSQVLGFHAGHTLARFELLICNPPLDVPALSQGPRLTRRR
jgi:hypothetical protein